MIDHVYKMTVAGHRGDMYNRYENTMESFKFAVENGVDMVETDVRVTKDGVLVLMHDDTVARTTDKEGLVREKTYEEISRINAGDENTPCHIPTYEEFMEWASKQNITLNIEIKEYNKTYGDFNNKERCDYCIDKVLELVDKYDMVDKVVINSFDAYVLQHIYDIHGKKYMLHGYYPYEKFMWNIDKNPDDYLYCACVFSTKNKSYYDYLIEKGIEPWIGAGVTQKPLLDEGYRFGAKLVTCNNTADILQKLKELGLR
jgi:glycerophosphoryl diester phosphodiesterase